MLTAAEGETSGPGWALSSAKVRAASSDKPRCDRQQTVPRSSSAPPALSDASGVRSSTNSLTSTSSGEVGSAKPCAAMMASREECHRARAQYRPAQVLAHLEPAARRAKDAVCVDLGIRDELTPRTVDEANVDKEDVASRI